MKHRSTLSVSITIIVLLFFTNSVLANPPYSPGLVSEGNRWTITFYDDSKAAHNQWATQGLCFYNIGDTGTHQRYVWVSDTYPDWNGIATQEGDQIFMHGDFQWLYGQQKDGGHDGMEWQIVTASKTNEGFGHWHEWVQDEKYGMNIGFGNTKLVRVGKCEIEKADEALEAYMFIERPRDKQGRYLQSPMGVVADITIEELN